jgi:hypothetical protein
VYDAIGQPLRQHLLDRVTEDAARRHLAAGARAAEEFAKMRAARLQPNPDTGRAKVGIIVTGEVIEENERLLGYITPWLRPPLPPRDDPSRRTFNLELVETGWAAFFPLYPSLPGDVDLNIAVQAAEQAWQQKRGAWAEFGDDLLLGYEYRACLKLGAADPDNEPSVPPEKRIAEAFRRVCVDLRTRKIVGLYGYHRIEPPYRLWIWNQDLTRARQDLNLQSGP